jgi:hypothetical protein
MKAYIGFVVLLFATDVIARLVVLKRKRLPTRTWKTFAWDFAINATTMALGVGLLVVAA